MAKRKTFGTEELRGTMSGPFYQGSGVSDRRESGRVKDASLRRVLDPAARVRRQKKAVDGLEEDNFHDDPHANLVMHKKAPKFEETFEAKRKRRSKGEPLKTRFKKNFNACSRSITAAAPLLLGVWFPVELHLRALWFALLQHQVPGSPSRHALHEVDCLVVHLFLVCTVNCR
ncbi:hypothetical protein HPB48_025354 [Haemaphysalis longicornis]|uniref:Uncharacterized protein n=1 Tax=Haemaphysalis longicornis TaxID=44386 RepID=A0A9J6H9H1_HAELO|nr:hypothetical protein HPB48_025354 [Haemaphysalis longicornis]